ncbi:MAG: oligosaccharide flippase family protein [Myxococcota bacterium]
MGESAIDDGRVRRSSMWIIVGYGGAQVLRFLSNVILSRMLYEEAFGLMAIVGSVLQGLELFSDIGIRPSIIRSEREDRRFLDTAWTLQALRGLILGLIAIGLTRPVAAFYDAPELIYLLPIAVVGSFIDSLQSTKLATETRELNLRRLEITTLVSQAMAVLGMVGWAAVDPTVTSLAAGAILGSITRLLMSHFYLPGPVNRFAWDKDAVTEVVTFGRWILLSTLIHFASSQSDKLIFGKLLTMEALGVYHMGAVIARLPVDA